MNDDDRSGWVSLALFITFYLLTAGTVWLVIQRINQLATK